MTFVVVGLGNPTEEYTTTRHNAGRLMVQQVADTRSFDPFEFNKKHNALETSGTIGKVRVTLLLPETMMNRSGKALTSVITSKKKAEKLVVIYDDIDLPFGSFKISFGRGSGGHKGVESVIRSVGTKDFVRIRIGVAPTTPGGKIKKPRTEDAVHDYLLGSFKPKELDVLQTSIAHHVDEAVEMILTNGRLAAMNAFN